MDKETLSNYGWIVILVLVLAVMLALATPFGTFIAGAIKSTTAGLFSVNQAALDSAGIDVNDMVFENCDHLETEVRNVTDTYTGDTCCKACGAVLQAGQTVKAKVPEGGVYYVGVTSATEKKYTGATTTYTAGQAFPETTNIGDVYVYESYEYRFGQYWEYGWKNGTDQNGWGVRCINNVAEPGSILESINGQPITNLRRTFAGLGGIVISPDIPSTVTNMNAIFDGCHKLTTAPNIPDGVIDLEVAFRSCPIKTYSGSTDPDGDFSNYIIPESATSLYLTFSSCANMVKAPTIPNGVTNMSSTFGGCTSLTFAPSIPESVTNMNAAFGGCASLTKAPVVPSGVKDVGGLFGNCTKLTGTIEINSTLPSGNSGSFRNVDFEAQNITLIGSSNYLDLLGATGINYCAECNGKCQGNH